MIAAYTPRLLAQISLVAIGVASLPSAAQAIDHQLAFGIHYWETVDKLEQSDFGSLEASGESYLLAYQLWPNQYFHWEFDLEFFDQGFQGATEAAISPIAYALFGKGLYGGVGVGIIYSEGFAEDDFSDPFYAARAGFNVDVVPHVKLDIHGNYRFDEVDQLDQGGSDTITLGALLRIDF